MQTVFYLLIIITVYSLYFQPWVRNTQTKFRHSWLLCDYYASSFIFTFLLLKVLNSSPCTVKLIITYLGLNASKTSHMCKGCCLKYVLHNDFWVKTSYQARTTQQMKTFHWIFTYIPLVIIPKENFDVYRTGKEPRGREWLGYGLDGAGFISRRA
jgi:hypothetical protein